MSSPYEQNEQRVLLVIYSAYWLLLLIILAENEIYSCTVPLKAKPLGRLRTFLGSQRQQSLKDNYRKNIKKALRGALYEGSRPIGRKICQIIGYTRFRRGC